MAAKQKNSESISSHIVTPPVVAVLGHVDHGKTTLLDAIRKTTVAEREHGGITQKIGASSVEIVYEGKKRSITLIDTPGHETFSKMRSRGAIVSDIGILVVSLADGVQPQTQEAIGLLKDAGIPYIVALTKADLPSATPDKVKQQLAKEGVLLEGLGGDVPFLAVSAKEGKNIKELLELVLLSFDMRVEKPALDRLLRAVVIESRLDIKAGPRATIVVKKGSITLKDTVICEGIVAKVRALVTDTGEQKKEAGVGEAVEVLGFPKVPPVGAIVTRLGDAEELAIKDEEVQSLSRNLSWIPRNQAETLPVILCADSEGTLEAILAAVPKQIQVISQKLGEIAESDVLLAKSSGAIVIGFNAKVRSDVMQMARIEKVLIRNYTIIYELLDELRDVIEGKRLALEERIFGTAKVLASFPFEKTKVLGILVTDGRVAKGDKVRIERGEEIVGEGTVASVRIGKNVTSKVEKGQEAGVVIAPLLDFTIGDVLLCHG